MECDHEDIRQAFLNADLKKPIYMYPPPGIELLYPEMKPGTLWRLKKSLYGLHVAAKNWNEHINKFLIQQTGFTRSLADPCLYTRYKDGTIHGRIRMGR